MVEPEEHGIYEEPIMGETIFRDVEIWDFGFNRLEYAKFFRDYNSLEKDLLDELELNNKIFDQKDDPNSLHAELINWLNKKANGISYVPDKDIFECDYLKYCEEFNRITFKYIYDNKIYMFLKELKKRLIQYSKVLELCNIQMKYPSLKWDKDKVDLIELMTALVESKSILRENFPVTKEFMAEFFSSIFVEMDLTNFAKDLNRISSKCLQITLGKGKSKGFIQFIRPSNSEYFLWKIS